MLLLVLFQLVSGIQFIFAEEPSIPQDIMNEVTNNISDEYCNCAAYFMIVSEGFKRSNEIETAEQYIKVSETALKFADDFAKQSRTEEMAVKVTSARMEMYTKSMIKEIGNNIENISILMNKYGQRCKYIMEEPDKTMYEWANKIINKRLNE